MDKIFVNELVLFGRIGVLRKEKLDGQNFVINIEIQANSINAGSTDSLEDTIDYATVVEMATALMKEASFHLIETYAEGLAKALFNRFSIARRIVIRIEKRNAPIDAEFASVGIEIERDRND